MATAFPAVHVTNDESHFNQVEYLHTTPEANFKFHIHVDKPVPMATCTPNSDTSLVHDALEASFGGYNCSFMQEPDQTLFCLICARVLREPQLTDCCGNHYCSSCLKKWLENSSSCPLCREKNFNAFKDKKTERRIHGLQVKCMHRTFGCSWTGGLGDLDGHLNQDCPCTLIKCTNECGNILQRQELPAHTKQFCLLRKVQCEYCSIEGTYQTIVSEHYDVCPEVPVACPNSCSHKPIPRRELSEHANICPLEKLPCNFNQFGCQSVVTRKDLDKHMLDSQSSHLLLMLTATAEFQRVVGTFRTETALLQEELQKLRSDYECLKEQNNERSSLSVLSLGVVEQHLAARAEDSLSEPFLPLIIKMTNFEQKKCSRQLWVSSPFYTEPFGYKLCLCVYANGCCSGEGTHMSVYVHLMAGEFDDELEWPAEEAITVELQNQLQSTHNHWVDCSFSTSLPMRVRSRVRGAESRARRGSGTPTFIPLSKLSYHSNTNCQYLKEDCLYFYVY